MMKLVALAMVAVCLQLVMSSPLQLVSMDGSCKSSGIVSSFISSQAIGKSGTSCPVAAAFDCCSENDGYSVLNSILETSFSADSRGKT